ncbi:MAG: tetratricopeptide repeat protein, partial [Bacteroidia bacterium]|nr:tetratricopeptide repeat protein [Bacteroidia bacterium]
FLLKGNTFMAEMYYNQALALDPDYEQAIMNKAGLYLSQKQTEKGKQLLQQFIKYHPKSAQVRALLSKL